LTPTAEQQKGVYDTPDVCVPARQWRRLRSEWCNLSQNDDLVMFSELL
jgi:hypothetical protein